MVATCSHILWPYSIDDDDDGDGDVSPPSFGDDDDDCDGSADKIDDVTHLSVLNNKLGSGLILFLKTKTKESIKNQLLIYK